MNTSAFADDEMRSINTALVNALESSDDELAGTGPDALMAVRSNSTLESSKRPPTATATAPPTPMLYTDAIEAMLIDETVGVGWRLDGDMSE